MMLGPVLATLAACVCAVPLETRAIDYPGLYFYNGRFEITVFQDLHLGDLGMQDGIPRGVWSDDLTVTVMDKVLDHEPATNLAVLNGDITTCEWVAEKDSYSLLDKAMAPLLKRKLPFAATFGNHDWSSTCNTRWMSEHIWRTANDPKNGDQLTFTTSTVAGDPNLVGTTNYFIPIYSKVDGKQVLKMIFWFFDSKGGYGYTGSADNRQPVYGYVHTDVIDWFKRTRHELESDHGGEAIPSLVFVHIPIAITDNFAQAGWRNAVKMPGIQYHEQLGVQDKQNDTIGDQFMQALVETENLLGIFSGHDHNTDWCMKWTKTPEPVPAGWPSATKGNGLNVCFGRHTGYGGYSEIMRGGRHIVVYENALGGDNAIETWNRLEDGEVSGRVMLNSTYGVDIYSRVEAKWSNGTTPLGEVAGRADEDGANATAEKRHSLTSKQPDTVPITSKTKVSSKIKEVTTTSKPTKSSMTSIKKKTTMITVTTKPTKATTKKQALNQPKSSTVKSSSIVRHNAP